MVQGVDVWLNTPRRPLEASGTSGQKAAVNGGLNLSILDGWWEEAHSPRTGWAFGRATEYADMNQQDEEDAAALYRVLEREVLPLYYARSASGVPNAWVKKMKTSMAALVPQFSSHRMVLDYARDFYLPAEAHGKAVRAREGAVAKALSAWREEVASSLPLMHLRRCEEGPHGSLLVEAFLGTVDPHSLLCWNSSRKEHKVKVEKVLGPGLYLLRIAGVTGDAGSRNVEPREYRLFPTHPALAQPHELGVAISIVVRG